MKTSHSFFSGHLWWLADTHWSASEIMHWKLILAMAFNLLLNGKGFGVREGYTTVCSPILRILCLRIHLTWIIQNHRWDWPWNLGDRNGLGFTRSGNTDLDERVFPLMNGVKHNCRALHPCICHHRCSHSTGQTSKPLKPTSQGHQLNQQQLPFQVAFSSFPSLHLFKPLY